MSEVKGDNEKFCADCGQIIHVKAEICPRCGVRQKAHSSSASGVDNRWLTTILLCVFVGWLGIHRFYTGHKLIGVLQLCTGGGCGIWVLIDMIFLVTGNYTDSDGNPITMN